MLNAVGNKVLDDPELFTTKWTTNLMLCDGGSPPHPLKINHQHFLEKYYGCSNVAFYVKFNGVGFTAVSQWTFIPE